MVVLILMRGVAETNLWLKNLEPELLDIRWEAKEIVLGL